MSSEPTRLPNYLKPYLKDAGWEEGDFLPVMTFSEPTTGSTTSTTYDYLTGVIDVRAIAWDTYLPSGGTTQVALSCRVAPGAGETLDIAVENYTDDENALEETGITSEDVNHLVGPVDYTPPTKTGVRLITKARTDPGSNSSEISEVSFIIGVKL